MDTFKDTLPPKWHCPKCKTRDGIQRFTERGLICTECGFREISERTADDPRTEDLWALERRWLNPDLPPYTVEHMIADTKRLREMEIERDKKRTWPPDPRPTANPTERREWREQRERQSLRDYAENPALRAQINANPENDAPRRAFAEWLLHTAIPKFQDDRTGEWFEHTGDPDYAAWVIHTQLGIAEELRVNPKRDMKAPILTPDGNPFAMDKLRMALWDQEQLATLDSDSLVEQQLYYRGFVEHVAMKARWFLDTAEELYSLAPIRYLTLTYCKDYLDQLLDSPHLERIRSLKLPTRVLNNQYTRLNEWTDEDIERIAASPRLRNLRYLCIDDAPQLSERALVALARSPHLTQLSYVDLNVNRYYQTIEHPEWGGLGDYHQDVIARPQLEMRRIVEAECGYVPWLHPHWYGTFDPDPEAAVEHPIALDAEVARQRGRDVAPDEQEPSIFDFDEWPRGPYE